jgi:C4-dicarboxylate-specific signal transduction histidine kinase
VTTLGELTASIAHEVNQPLTAIVADANAALNWLATADPDLGKARETLSAIMKDGERAAGVLVRIRNMLSRSAQPHAPCSLCRVIREAIPLVRSEYARYAIRLQTSLAADLPAVMGDCIQLQQVLLNLLLNAAEASKEIAPERRRVTVCAAVRRGAQRTCAVVEVRDAGVGIRESEFAQLFDAFYSTKPNGLGMGLSISRGIIERHGGRLWATANPDYGATFHFSLPALP